MEAWLMRTPLTVTRAGAVKELATALRREKRAVNQIRIRAVLSVARGNHVPMVAQWISVAERAVRNWVHRYNRRGLVGLQDQRKGRQCRLSDSQLKKIRKRLREGARPEDGVCSLRGRDIQRVLEKEFHVRYCRSSVYYFLHHQLGMSYLKPRPIHRKTDPEAQAAFKKTSEKSCKTSEKRIRTDGSRSGSRTKAGSASKAH
jgi:transposase